MIPSLDKRRFRIYKNINVQQVHNKYETGLRGCVAFLVKHGLVINKEYRNEDVNIITENEALAINLDLSNNQNITLATIYCPNGNPNLSFFQIINNLSENVIFVGDFNYLSAVPRETPLVLCSKIFKTNLTLFTWIMMNIHIWTELKAAQTY